MPETDHVDLTDSPSENHVKALFEQRELIENVSVECAKQVRQRDKLCLITGEKVTEANKRDFTVVNVIPPDCDMLWEDLDIPRLVKDPHADLKPENKQTIQNAMLLHSDVVDAWTRGEITIDSNRGHAIIAFRKEWQHLHGQKLHLEHLTGLSQLAPLDACFEEHKTVSIVTNVIA
ncbi:hypothetical protein Clacol_006572 [Clathrus columnatus]|uniref:HNH nuclease domain-containing protein n=1 Tax=Clathrus columnatus TaxID=1419009 RepID=A0AAV5ACF1_9AGAM|nr:hypothetical protein Clacol_006572 [Clathrus columnatus]